MSKLDTEIKPMKSVEAGSDEQDANTVTMTSVLKSKATRKMNHTVRRIIQLPRRYSQGLKAPRNEKEKDTMKDSWRTLWITWSGLAIKSRISLPPAKSKITTSKIL